MLSLEVLIRTLCPEQKSLKRSDGTLPETLAPFFTNHIDDYYVIDTDKRNRTCSLLESLLNVLDPGFKNMFPVNRDEYLKALRRKMSADIDKENLFKSFNYQKLRDMKKSKIQKALLSLKHRIDTDENATKFVIDYFSLNVLVFVLQEDNTFTTVQHILSTDDTLVATPYKPFVFLMKKGNTYHAICNDKLKFHLYPDNPVLKNLLHIYSNMLDNEQETSTTIEKRKIEVSTKMKLDDIRTYAQSLGIDVMKTSKKTGNRIKKSKKELVEEINDHGEQ